MSAAGSPQRLFQIIVAVAVVLWASSVQAQISAKDFRRTIRAERDHEETNAGVAEIQVVPFHKTMDTERKNGGKDSPPERPELKNWRQAKEDLGAAQRGVIVAGKPSKLMHHEGEEPYYQFPTNAQKERTIAIKKQAFAKAEKGAARFLPKKGPSLNSGLEVGKTGSLDYIVTLVQVLNNAEAIAETGVNGKSEVFVICNVSTVDWADGKKMRLKGQLKVTGTHQYPTALGDSGRFSSWSHWRNNLTRP